jgi:hypothetical protein
MHFLLAESIDGGLYAAAALLFGLVATVLALCAIAPAWQRKGRLTLAMTLPAMIFALIVTIYIGYGYITERNNPDFTFGDFAGLWLIGAGPPLTTSLLAIVVFLLRGKKNVDA